MSKNQPIPMKPFNQNEATQILQTTPGVLNAFLRNLPESWIDAREGAETWSSYDIVGHLIHGEKTDWVPRTCIILEEGKARPFRNSTGRHSFGIRRAKVFLKC